MRATGGALENERIRYELFQSLAPGAWYLAPDIPIF